MKTPHWFYMGLALLAAQGPARAQPAPHPAWSYSGKADPAHWYALEKANAACKLSRQQSPIDIDRKRVRKAAPAPLRFDYKAGSAQVVNTGHTVQLNVPAGASLTTAEGAARLLQLHFHAPSEERFNGVRFPMVAHLVHKNVEDVLFVVAVLFKQGRENAALAPLFAALPAEGKSLTLSDFDPATLLPSRRAYYRFTGSLTTPPCSDGVRWHVLQEPVELSKQQIAAFRRLYPMNARPVQPLHGRVVESSE